MPVRIDAASLIQVTCPNPEGQEQLGSGCPHSPLAALLNVKLVVFARPAIELSPFAA